MGFLFICIIALTFVSFLSILGAEPFVFDLEEELLPIIDQSELAEEVLTSEEENIEDEILAEEEVLVIDETQEHSTKLINENLPIG